MNVGRLRLLLIIYLLTACQKDNDVGLGLPTAETLYHTWRLTQVLYNGQDTRSADQYIQTVTFARDGKFLRGQKKDNRWCCGPVSFKGNDTAIQFIWDTSDPACELINCRMSALRAGIIWQITTLTAGQLVLTDGKTTLIFEPEP